MNILIVCENKRQIACQYLFIKRFKYWFQVNLCCVLVHDSQVVLEKTTKGADLLILSFLSGIEQERHRNLVLFCTLRPMVLESSKAQIKGGNCLVLRPCFTEKSFASSLALLDKQGNSKNQSLENSLCHYYEIEEEQGGGGKERD